MISKRLLPLLILMLLWPATALAQENTAAPPQAAEGGATQQELKQKALGLLEDVIKDSELFRHAENRIRVRAAAAGALWDHDPARARILFKDAMASLADLLNNLDEGDEPAHARAGGGPRQLRGELLQALAVRDPRLARELLRTTRAQDANGRERRGDVLADQPLELTLATQIADNDPHQAVEMAEESLSRGLSYELPGVLSALHEKDPAAAAKLAGQIAARLRTEKFAESDVAKQTAVSLLRLATQAPEDAGNGPKTATPLLDAQAMHELIEKLAAEALRPNTTSPELVAVLQEMMPAVEKYAPARAAQIKRRAEQQNSGQAAQSAVPDGEWQKYQSILEKGNAEELLAAAPNAPEGMRDSFYLMAASKLVEAGDAAGARRVINEHIQEPDMRKQVLAQMEQRAAFTSAEQGNLEQARKTIAALRTNEERVMALAQLAEGAVNKGDKKLALALLDEASEMSSARAKNARQLLAQLAVARGYAPLDASRSLAILESAVDQLNELLAAGVLLGGFFAEEFVRDDEIMMEILVGISGEFFTRYVGDISTLARADFDRTRALADRFQRPEVRTIARMLVAQSVLTPQGSPAARPAGSVIMGGRMQ
ncbi:MAG TPA: hypothetical protein VN256_09800 [Pyrinomonadaceae bacterium]|nr:hypothetical protein [Pyrinomonadaceae bacterium]